MAEVIVNTSDHNFHSMCAWLKNRFAPESTEKQTKIMAVRFGFKYGVPLDADQVFDLRFLPNTHFVTELRERPAMTNRLSNILKKAKRPAKPPNDSMTCSIT